MAARGSGPSGPLSEPLRDWGQQQPFGAKLSRAARIRAPRPASVSCHRHRHVGSPSLIAGFDPDGPVAHIQLRPDGDEPILVKLGAGGIDARLATVANPELHLTGPVRTVGRLTLGRITLDDAVRDGVRRRGRPTTPAPALQTAGPAQLASASLGACGAQADRTAGTGQKTGLPAGGARAAPAAASQS